MQMFHLASGSQLKLAEEIMPIPLQEIRVGDRNVIERNLVDLVVEYPQLLNYGTCDLGSPDNAELLILDRETETTTNKRFDLLALDDEGRPVVIEMKRDSKDQKARREALEFQAIRYAASCRKLTIDGIAERFARYLWKKEHSNDGEYTPEENAKYRARAIREICQHLSDEDDFVTEADLGKRTTTSEGPRIYLVAGDYDPDVTSACAWLRSYKVDISCFRLRPYRIEGTVVLQRECLIPPPELADFLGDIKDRASPANASEQREKHATSVKPVRVIWGAEDQKEIWECNRWKSVLERCASKALDAGLPIAELPMRKRTTDGKINDDFTDDDVTIFIEKYQVRIDCYAGRVQIESWIRKMREGLGMPRGLISIELADGSVTEP